MSDFEETPRWKAAVKYVWEDNSSKWSNNDDTAGDNFGSFLAGWDIRESEITALKSEVERLKSALEIRSQQIKSSS